MENKVFWTDFLQIYKGLPCLWDMRSPDYKNRYKKNAGYEILLRKLQSISPKATEDILKKKISNMRTCFKRELRKVRRSKETSPGSESIYQPNLWYYDLMLFLENGEIERKGLLDDENSDEGFEFIKNENSDYNMYEDEFAEQNQEMVKQLEQSTNDPFSANAIGESSLHNSSCSSFQEQNNKKAMLNNLLDQKTAHLVDIGHNCSRSNDDDEFSVTGKRIAYQLKGMGEHQRLIAEKLISDIMFFGRINKLKENASVNCGI